MTGEREVHMLVTTAIGPTLKCGKAYEPGVRLTEDKKEVTCSKCN